jgi:WD40 repeat protein/serine/threonine protein kinase
MPEPAGNPEVIFLAALDRTTPQERVAYIEGACAGQPGLLQRVRELLAAHEQSRGPLDVPPPDLDVTVDLPAVAEMVGVHIGPYKLLQQIGEGGMGTVYMAEQQEPVRRKVALKIIKPGMGSAQVIARFEVERQALALMDHQNIARVLDAGTTEDGRPYFVMELVHGVSITRFCDDYQLTPRQRLELFIPVCHAIQHAHQKGIIHRDIKPSNVLVTLYDDKPVPKVIDFGVAKAIEQPLTEKTLFTQFGGMVGTFEYMSPEQAELNALGVDTRSDVYSLGVLLYELLTGTTPLEKKRLRTAALDELVRLIREEEPPRPSTRLSSSGTLAEVAAARRTEPAQLSRLVRGELDWIVMRALEKDRSRRYDSASSLARDVECYLHDEPVQAGPPSAAYRLRKFVKRNRGVVLAAAVVLLTLVAGVIGTTVGLVRALQSEQRAVTARDEEIRQRERAVLAEKDAIERANDAITARKDADREKKTAEEERDRARFQALRAEGARHVFQIDQALRAWGQHDVIEAERLLATVEEPLHQSWEQRHVRDLCRRQALPLTGHSFSVWSVALSHDGKQVISGAGRIGQPGEVKVWDATTGQNLLTLTGHSDQVSSVAISADGSRIVSASLDRTVRVWDAEGHHLRTLEGHTLGVFSVAISADGKRIASGDGDFEKPGEIKVWDAETGKEKLSLKGHANYVHSVAISADGQWIVSGGGDGTVRVWDAATGERKHNLKKHTAAVMSVAISPDGKRLVSGGYDRAVRVWDSQTGHELRSHQHTGFVTSVAISGDSQRLVAGSQDGRAVKVWNLATGEELLTLLGHTAFVNGVAISHDGKRIVSGSFDRTVRVWDISARQDQLSFKAPTDRLLSLAMDRAGRRLATSFASTPGTMKVWDTATCRDTLTLETFTRGVALSADGKRIVTGSEFGNDPPLGKVWDAATGRQVLTLQGHEFGVWSMAFSADGRRIATGSMDTTVKVWDAQTGLELRTLKGHTFPVYSVAFSADGKRLVSGSYDNTARVWDAVTGKELYVLTGHKQPVHCVAISGDGQWIASASEDQTVKVWDASTGKVLHTLEGHTGRVDSVAISADSQRIASAGADATVRIWDARTGQEKIILKGHAGAIRGIAFSEDGQSLVSASEDGTIKVWAAPISKPNQPTAR